MWAHHQTQLLNDWIRFANLMGQRELTKLDLAGIDYRLPIPGAKFDGKQLVANIIYPGLTIEYSVDNGTVWTQYVKPVTLENNHSQILVRSKSLDGKRTSRVEAVK